mmetsp:Transcript_29975/g.52612  ORF Transcript_29975/g.52612 Transcript_29975/m.52612 type:complete len:159 (-) Transcript_29975:139-615(-)
MVFVTGCWLEYVRGDGEEHRFHLGRSGLEQRRMRIARLETVDTIKQQKGKERWRRENRRLKVALSGGKMKARKEKRYARAAHPRIKKVLRKQRSRARKARLRSMADAQIEREDALKLDSLKSHQEAVARDDDMVESDDRSAAREQPNAFDSSEDCSSG